MGGFPPYEDNDDAYLVVNPTVTGAWHWPYRHDHVSIKWNDAWLSNQDCDGDGKLDRPNSYVGSGAWTTNHQSGNEDEKGNPIPQWMYFVKIVALPTNAVCAGGNGSMCSVNGQEFGYRIWDDMAIVQQVYSDPALGYHGLLFNSPLTAGLGYYK